MLGNELKDIYLNLYTVQQVAQDSKLVDLLNFLELANSKKHLYSVSDFVMLMALSYHKNKNPNFKLTSSFAKTFDSFLKFYSKKEALEIDTWLKIKQIPLQVLIDSVNISNLALYDIRKGYSRPRYDTLVAICNALGIELSELKLPPARKRTELKRKYTKKTK